MVSELADSSFARILLIKPSSLGDIVHALPVLHGLRARYPRARIDWLVAAPFVSLLDGHPDLDEPITFDRARFARLGRSANVTFEFASFLRKLRARRYDLAIDLQGLFRTGFLALASGARVRLGFRSAREGAWVFYTHPMPVPSQDMHAVDRNYLVSRWLGFQDVKRTIHLDVTDEARGAVRASLSQHGLADGVRFVVLSPGARWETKTWPADRFAETVDRLASEFDVRCVLVGSAEERDLCDRVAGATRVSPINLAGRTTIPELIALLERADLVVCHDSAVAHLAAALDRPLVCLCGPTNPNRTGPYRRTSDVVQLKLDCSPCYLRRLSQCRHGHKCMVDLEVSRVVAAAGRSLSPVVGGLV